MKTYETGALPYAHLMRLISQGCRALARVKERPAHTYAQRLLEAVEGRTVTVTGKMQVHRSGTKKRQAYYTVAISETTPQS